MSSRDIILCQVVVRIGKCQVEICPAEMYICNLSLCQVEIWIGNLCLSQEGQF